MKLPRGLDFSGIHYYRHNSFQDFVFIIVVGGEKNVTRWYQTDDGDVSEDETVREVIGMVSLQQSPYEENIVWLNFIEVHPDHQGKGIAKSMCNDVADVMHGVFSNKILHRSSVSEKCPKHMTAKFDEWYNSRGVVWAQERKNGK